MMILIIKTLFFYIFSVSALANSNAVLGESFPEKEKITLRVAIGDKGYTPFIQIENDEIKGFTADIFDYITANSKYNFEYIIVPWPRALVLVSNGQLDLIPIFFKTEKREQLYHFIQPSYANEVNQLFALKSNKIEFDGDLQQLLPYSIGIRREYSYGQAFDQAKNLQKSPAVNEEILLKLLLNGLVDSVISNPLVLNPFISEYNATDKVKAIEPYISTTPVFLALTKEREDSQEIKDTFEKTLKRLITTPYYQELLEKYQLNYQ